MEWLGFFCLVIIICYSSYPKKVRQLERKVKKNNERDKQMLKLIAELVGKKCCIVADDSFGEIKCEVIDIDDEWVKVRIDNKKNKSKIKIIRIDSINSVELLED